MPRVRVAATSASAGRLHPPPRSPDSSTGHQEYASCRWTKRKPTFTLPKLPYAENALEPVISAKTISFHYGKHHKAYVDKLNELIAGTPYDGHDARGDRQSRQGREGQGDLQQRRPGLEPRLLLAEHDAQGRRAAGQDQGGRSKTSFGGVDGLQEGLRQAAVGQFGSGWAWLVKGKDGKLEIETTSNADTPIAHGGTPLLVTDVWEHAYYLDYQNRRPDHVKAWLDKLANWSFAEKNLS